MAFLQMMINTTYFSTFISTGVGFFIGFLLARKLRRIPKIVIPSKYSDMKLVIVARTDLGMTKGKIAAQCSHATLACYKKALKIDSELLRTWENQGQPKVVLKTESEESLYKLSDSAKDLGVINYIIHDAGRTQIAAGSATCIGIGPADVKLVDQVTGHLKLL
ncbi:hypothetical protein Ciccas_004760 [Cichlidogyrus casuarinus]|uniref:peptidyl-tRNA hydrolase n=1 Tax=Cichlidogyrus casuarinus TaxID=1844966 RepID=A0ABD2QCV7_9PLAT